MTIGEKLKLIFDTGCEFHDISDQQWKDIISNMRSDSEEQSDKDEDETSTFPCKLTNSFNELLKAHDHSIYFNNKTPENMAIHIDNLRSIAELYITLRKNVGI